MKTKLHHFFAIFLSMLILAGGFAIAQDRVALLIGNNDYPEDGNFHSLKNCVNDVSLLEKTLQGVGFKVTKLTNATQAKMDEALLAFENSVPAGGTALVYFAGHGIEYQGQNYLMGSNAKLQARSRLGEEALKAETFAAAMVHAGAGTSFLLLDCCRELPTSADWAGRGQRKFGLADISIEGDIVIGMAASPGKQALEPSDAGGNSPYALALAKWIPKGVGHLNLFQNVRKEVHEMTDGQQRTWENGSFLNPFYFARGTDSAGGSNEKLVALQAEIERLRKNAELAGTMKRTEATSVPKTNPGGSGFPADAKFRGFTNTLGMKFVPVPGSNALFCEHETRVQDYAAFVEQNSGVDREWENYEFEGHKQGPDHPVVNVSWEDAKAFCAWLSKKEGKKYRLPTDHEWSLAVGIGTEKNVTGSPEDKKRKIEGVYPWGKEFPPPPGSGNYNGNEGANTGGKIEGYRDEHPFTSPVKSYKANEYGLYDVGGNAGELCEDRYSNDQRYPVLRGGSWRDFEKDHLRSSFRFLVHTFGFNFSGFRLVVESGGG